MSQSKSPDFVNVEVSDVLADRQEEREVEKKERAKEGSLRRKIEKRREDKTIHVRIEGAKVPFGAPGGEVDQVQDMVADFAGKDEEELTQAELQKAHEFRDRIPELLAEKCKDPSLTVDFWKDTFPPQERQVFLGKLANGGEEGKDAEGFRQK